MILSPQRMLLGALSVVGVLVYWKRQQQPLFQQQQPSRPSGSTGSRTSRSIGGRGRGSRRPHLLAPGQDRMRSSCGQDLDSEMKIEREGCHGEADGGEQEGDKSSGREQKSSHTNGGADDESKRSTAGTSQRVRMAIPFFGSGDDDAQRRWSQLNFRVDEYKQDLVKVVQSLDTIINILESTAPAKINARTGDMPGDGMRRLADKFRLKLEKTPPRWQVNTDVLSWLLRPVPFVAGLPAPPAPPAPTPPVNSDDDNDVHDTAPGCGRGGGWEDVVVADGSGSGATGKKEIARTEEHQVIRAGPGGDVGEEAPSASSAAAQERRAIPVLIFKGDGGDGGGGSGGGGEGEEGPKNRTGFHSYDETHQIFTHILRDWTSEGDSVRTAVYAPLLKALDQYVGWEEDATTSARHHEGRAGSCRFRVKVSSGAWDDTAGDGVGRCGYETDPPRAAVSSSSSTTTSCTQRRTANILVPGAGLGRLATEIAARGYASVHANELSTTMLSSSYWLLEALRGAHCMAEGNGQDVCGTDWAASVKDVDGSRGGAAATTGGGFFEFYPFLNDAAHNEIDGEARFRSVLFPDPAGRDVLARASGRLSFQAGEFSATYGVVGGPYEGVFDAVVTSFFVDTAPNVVQYVATIRRVLRLGGVWINCGPLHWHNHSALALSLDEMLLLVAGSGFRLEQVRQLPPSPYRVDDGGGSLRVDEFRPVFWVAVLEGPP